MFKVLDLAINDRNFIFCFAYLFAFVQTSPISFVAGGKGPFSVCNKGNRRRLHAGNLFIYF